jgi:S-adenosylmethionine:tRNA ribosyltransferase-isomerase
MQTSDFDYDLPEELIAQVPLEERGMSRLLVLDDSARDLEDREFGDLPSYLRPGDRLIFNDTRVIKARLTGRKETGGAVEVMVDQIRSDRRLSALIKASRRPKVGQRIFVGPNVEFLVTSFSDGIFELESSENIGDCLDQFGDIPIPPYLKRSSMRLDDERYQTVYGTNPGAVAAPTAGLHFDGTLIDRLRVAGVDTSFVTLHVGAGTFRPVNVEDINSHKMHSERFIFPKQVARDIYKTRAAGGRIVAVGTTSLRVLETVYAHGEPALFEGETDIFITPGHVFKVVDCLITNFHLPRSTLLMLVSAFAGVDKIKTAYQHAIEKKYRFFSYGDAMLLVRS